jgi:hypothetical protein
MSIAAQSLPALNTGSSPAQSGDVPPLPHHPSSKDGKLLSNFSVTSGFLSRPGVIVTAEHGIRREDEIPVI